MTGAPDPEMQARAERFAEAMADRLCVYVGVPPRGALWDHEYQAAKEILRDALLEQREDDQAALIAKAAP